MLLNVVESPKAKFPLFHSFHSVFSPFCWCSGIDCWLFFSEFVFTYATLVYVVLAPTLARVPPVDRALLVCALCLARLPLSFLVHALAHGNPIRNVHSQLFWKRPVFI